MRFKQNPKQEIKNEDAFLRHFKYLAFAVLLFSLLILVQIFRWQVLESNKFRTIAEGQYTEKQRSSSSRGIIYAANESVLAIDEPSWSIYATLSADKTEKFGCNFLQTRIHY